MEENVGNTNQWGGYKSKRILVHLRFLVKGKLCCVIIDGGNCTNVVSTRLFFKFNLETKPHFKY